MQKLNRKEVTRRVVALLNKDEMEFLNRLSVDASFSTGRRLTKVDIIASLIDVAMDMGVSSMHAKSREEFSQKIISAVFAYAEKRKYPRVKKCFDVSFRPLESMQEYTEVKTQDFSLGGISFYVSESHLPRINQMLEVVISDSTGRSIKAIGRVARADQAEKQGQVKIGLSLTYVDERYLEDLKNFLDE